MHFKGWLLHGDSSLATKLLPVEGAKSKLLLQRDPFTNSLSVSISPEKKNESLNSVEKDSHEILLSLDSIEPLPHDKPVLHLPISISEHINIKRFWIDASLKRIHVLLLVDDLGVDLFLANLFSPLGIKGVVDFPSSNLAFPIEARAEQPQFPWAKVWSGSGYFPWHECFEIQSLVEYAVFVDRVKIKKGGNILVKEVGDVIDPWDEICVCVGAAEGEVIWEELEVEKRVVHKIPEKLTSTYSEKVSEK